MGAADAVPPLRAGSKAQQILTLGIHNRKIILIHIKYYYLRDRILSLLFFFIPTLVVTETSHQQITTSSFQIPKLWECSAPLIAPEQSEIVPSHAEKDSGVVFFDGKWHVSDRVLFIRELG